MSTTVKKFKLFMPHQDQEQEAWLGAMAARGLHLVRAGAFGIWTFRRGAPAEVAYRTDFKSIAHGADYRQLFHDAGWELAGTMGACQYWRKPIVDGRVPEIHTDPQSKIAKFQRMLVFLFFMLMPMMLTSFPMMLKQLSNLQGLQLLPISVMACICIVLLLYAYTIVGLLVRIRSLRGSGHAGA